MLKGWKLTSKLEVQNMNILSNNLRIAEDIQFLCNWKAFQEQN